MEPVTTDDIVRTFTRTVQEHLDPEALDGPVRLDNTHTVAIIPVKGKGPVHAHLHGNLDNATVADLLGQLRKVPSLAALVRD
jgi:hypothetical protein